MGTPIRLRLSVASLCAALALTACGAEGTTCHSSDECSGSLECAGPSEPQVCGIPGNEQCGSDEECGEGLRCHALYDSCSPDSVGSECRVPCSEGSCGEGFRCEASGACEVISCDEGYACASYQLCDPSVSESGPIHARAHGCVAISCSEDTQCPSEGACVNGVCQESLGSCVEPQLVP